MKPKHIGIIAVSAPGAALCYQTIISESEHLLGPKQNPEITLNHPNFNAIFAAQTKRDWQTVADILIGSVNRLAAAGADFAIMPGNSTHFAFAKLQQASPIPVLSIVDTTITEAKRLGFTKAAILGVGLTMSDGLYVDPLTKTGIVPFTPPPDDQRIMNDIIYSELVRYIIRPKSVNIFHSMLESYKKSGCDGALLACTELPMVLTPETSPIPVVDSTRILAKAAVTYALS